VENSDMFIAPKSQPVAHTVDFRGTTNEYFGIWIVNVLLSIATLGIYSAWAKVRDKKYMYGNTFVDGYNFDYHAQGKQILFGRIVVVSLLALVQFSPNISMQLYGIVLLVFISVMGFLLSRGLRFNARMSSYRNVRFNFDGTAWKAFLSFVLYPFLAIFTFYLLYPFASLSKNRYVANHHYFGDRKFSFDADVGQYFGPFFGAIGIGLLGIIAAFIIAIPIAAAFDPSDQNSAGMIAAVVILYLIMGLTYIPAYFLYKVAIRNILFNNTVLDDRHEFISTLKFMPYAWIVFSNAVLAVFTLGLMIPWGRIRLAHYVAANTQVVIDGNLDDYQSEVQDSIGASGAEYADLEGFDFDFGF